MENEKIYDEKIAPKLKAISEECKELDFAFIAKCEWETGDTGTTAYVPEGAGIEMQLTRWAAMSNGNVDTLIMAIKKYAKKHGHSSIFLKILEER